jgi:DNA mismatch endonuclease (patch repair protein)
MTDIVSKEQRSRMMAGIRCKNTQPEMSIRHELFSKGFRYRLHDKKLPGKPDLVFPQHRTALFINGCFWHGHNCELFRSPSSNQEFWKMKISANKINDAKNRILLMDAGWKVVTVWECAMRGKKSMGMSTLIEKIAILIRTDTGEMVHDIMHQ